MASVFASANHTQIIHIWWRRVFASAHPASYRIVPSLAPSWRLEMDGDDMGDLDDLLRQSAYAKIRNCSARTIERERTSGTGCQYIKIGRTVRYRRRDILEFIERHARHSTSETSPPENEE